MVTLQAQLAFLKEQAAHCIMNGTAANPNLEKFYGGNGGGGGGGGEIRSFSQDVQSWWQSSQNQSAAAQPQFDANFHSSVESAAYFAGAAAAMNGNPNPCAKENSSFGEENNHSFGSFDSGEMQSSNERQWPYQDDADDLQSVAFRYIHHS